MQEQLLKEINEKLDLLIKVSVLSSLGQESRQKQIELLLSFGIKSSKVADILGLKTNYVTAVSSKASKKSRPKKI